MAIVSVRVGMLLTLANAVANMTVSGSLGLSGTPTPVAFVDRLVVQPGSGAVQSGIQTGDLLDWHRLSPAVRSDLAEHIVSELVEYFKHNQPR